MVKISKVQAQPVFHLRPCLYHLPNHRPDPGSGRTAFNKQTLIFQSCTIIYFCASCMETLLNPFHNNYFFSLVFTGVNASTKHVAAEKQVRLVFTSRTKRNYFPENWLVMYYIVVMHAPTMGESCPLLQIWRIREHFWNILVWSQ